MNPNPEIFYADRIKKFKYIFLKISTARVVMYCTVMCRAWLFTESAVTLMVYIK